MQKIILTRFWLCKM